jgi:hypothetical protein
VELMHGADRLAAVAAPGVLDGSGTAACETVVAVGVQLPRPAALPPAGARMDPPPAAVVSELVPEGTPVLDRQR